MNPAHLWSALCLGRIRRGGILFWQGGMHQVLIDLPRAVCVASGLFQIRRSEVHQQAGGHSLRSKSSQSSGDSHKMLSGSWLLPIFPNCTDEVVLIQDLISNGRQYDGC